MGFLTIHCALMESPYLFSGISHSILSAPCDMPKQTVFWLAHISPYYGGKAKYIFNRITGWIIGPLYMRKGEGIWKRGENVREPTQKEVWNSLFHKNSLEDGCLLAWPFYKHKRPDAHGQEHKYVRQFTFVSPYVFGMVIYIHFSLYLKKLVSSFCL